MRQLFKEILLAGLCTQYVGEEGSLFNQYCYDVKLLYIIYCQVIIIIKQKNLKSFL